MNLKSFAKTAAVLAGLAAPPLAAETRFSGEEAQLLQDGLTTTADAFILPAYRAYAAATGDLAGALAGFCAGTGDIAPARAAFADAFLSWQRAAIVEIGPVMAAEGPLRVQLWPDPKDFSRRAVRLALGEEDPALLASGGLEGRSVALVNLTALEDLLYRDLAPGSYACDLAAAIAAFQHELGEALVDAWTPGSAFRRDYDGAATGNARFASVDDPVRELLAGAVVHADRLRKAKIDRGLGAEAGQARPERTEAIASGLGLASIEAGFRALADLYQTPGGLFDVTQGISGSMEPYMLGETARSIADTLAAETRSLAEIAREDGAMAEELRGFGRLTVFHEDFLKTGLPQSLGLTTGFTSTDGD